MSDTQGQAVGADRMPAALVVIAGLAFIAFIVWLFWGPRADARQTQNVWVGCCACAAHGATPAAARFDATPRIDALPMPGARPKHIAPPPAVMPPVGFIEPVTMPSPSAEWSAPGITPAAVSAVPYAIPPGTLCVDRCGAPVAAVAEPGTAGLMAFGVVAIGVAARRRRAEVRS